MLQGHPLELLGPSHSKVCLCVWSHLVSTFSHGLMVRALIRIVCWIELLHRVARDIKSHAQGQRASALPTFDDGLIC